MSDLTEGTVKGLANASKYWGKNWKGWFAVGLGIALVAFGANLMFVGPFILVTKFASGLLAVLAGITELAWRFETVIKGTFGRIFGGGGKG